MNKYNIDIFEYIDEKFNIPKKQKEYLKDNLIFAYVSGSHAYGMNTPESDLDIRGLFLEPVEDIIKGRNIEQFENKEFDITFYSVRKGLKLLFDQNPNIQELLWVEEEDILYKDNVYNYIRSQRDKFLSKKVRHTYSGYAISQLNRIKGHNKWLVKEQEGKFDKKPDMMDYLKFFGDKGEVIRNSKKLNDIEKVTVLTKETNTIFKVWSSSNVLVSKGWISSNYGFKFCTNVNIEDYQYCGVLMFNKDQFDIDLKEYQDYLTWKNNRNVKRHELEKKYSFDTKHASHLVRLLNMCQEILETKKVLVKRPDAKYLLDIRKGKLSYEELMSWAEKVDKEILPILYTSSELPHSLSVNVLEELMWEVYNMRGLWKLKL